MKRLLTTACLFVVTAVAIVSFIAPAVFGQEKKTATVNSSPAKSVTARVDKLFTQWDKPDSPGCALGIVKDGRLIYKRGYGMANLKHNIPISSKSVFPIASTSKQFTAMSILLLAKQGKLSLDDDIQKYVPELPRYQSPITIRHLIFHTSGIRNHGQSIALSGMLDVRLTDDVVLGLIARQKQLDFKPGEELLYSNTGYFLMSLIVKRVSGKSLREFTEANIFKPLGMNNTHFRGGQTLVVKNLVTGYHIINGGFSVAKMDYNDQTSPGAGGLRTSVEDLFLWDQNFYNNKLGGGPDLISEQLSTGKLNNGEKTDYAFGLQVDDYEGLKMIGHGGLATGFKSQMIRFPEQRFSVICLCNADADSINPHGLATQVADIFLADQFKKGAGGVSETVAAAPDIISIPEKELASLTGTYFDHIREYTFRFYMKDGKLMIFNTALSPLSQNRFKVVGGGPPGLEIVFVRPIAGGRMQVMFKHRSGKTETFNAVQSETPTSAQLVEFTGKYLSDELAGAGATYTLSVNDGKLVMEAMGRKDILLKPLFADVFLIVGLIHWYPGDANSEQFLVRFMRNRQNAVSGFTLNRKSQGPRNLCFNKL